MKTNPIKAKDTEILVSGKGKTLDRVLGGGNNSNPSANCYLINFDYENPPIAVGKSVSELCTATTMFDYNIPIQFVYDCNHGMDDNGLCDIIYPYNPETKEIKCESIFKFRHYRLNNVIRDDLTLTMCANLTTVVDDTNTYPDLCYKSYPVSRVHVDVDKKTVTYLELIEDDLHTFTFSAVFSFLVPEGIGSNGRYTYGSPKAIEAINSGTQLKLYLDTTIDGQDYFIINIATQNGQNQQH